MASGVLCALVGAGCVDPFTPPAVTRPIAVKSPGVAVVPDAPTTAPVSPWTIERDGSTTVVTWPSGRTVRLTGAARTEEGRLVDRVGENVLQVVYPDGRAYRLSRCVAAPLKLPASRIKAFFLQHDHPAEVTVVDETGRTDRLSPGDANNDGYNESTGTYRIEAVGPRVAIAITPRPGEAVLMPILEVHGLRAGAVHATAEGQWLRPTRQGRAGTVWVPLPLVIERPIVVTVKAVPVTETVDVGEN